MNLLCEEQAGFRKKYGTTDHIFNLKCIIDLYLFRGKKLFCAFIDYRKAFDSVNRSFLWQKLLTHHVDGKMFKIIHSLYANAKSCVRMGHAKSEFFVEPLGFDRERIFPQFCFLSFSTICQNSSLMHIMV